LQLAAKPLLDLALFPLRAEPRHQVEHPQSAQQQADPPAQRREHEPQEMAISGDIDRREHRDHDDIDDQPRPEPPHFADMAEGEHDFGLFGGTGNFTHGFLLQFGKNRH